MLLSALTGNREAFATSKDYPEVILLSVYIKGSAYSSIFSTGSELSWIVVMCPVIVMQ